MPVVVSPESELGKELAKWNAPKRFQMFPFMLYKAMPYPGTGKVQCGDPIDDDFSRRCQRFVNSEEEMRVALNDGWAKSAMEALDKHEAAERAIADAAAEANYAAQRMTPKAQAERAKREAATDKHLPE